MITNIINSGANRRVRQLAKNLAKSRLWDDSENTVIYDLTDEKRTSISRFEPGNRRFTPP